jgi:hypothetical protein
MMRALVKRNVAESSKGSSQQGVYGDKQARNQSCALWSGGQTRERRRQTILLLDILHICSDLGAILAVAEADRGASNCWNQVSIFWSCGYLLLRYSPSSISFYRLFGALKPCLQKFISRWNRSCFFAYRVLFVYNGEAQTYGVIVVHVYLDGGEKSSTDGLDGLIDSLPRRNSSWIFRIRY